MVEISNLGLFITMSWILIITPGPDIIYVITRGMSLGRKAGLYSAFGVTLGLLVHTTFAALGLSIILKTSGMVFQVIKYLGAGYLIFLGVRAIIERNKLTINNKLNNLNKSRIFLQGLLSNVFNPKVALFFLAFLPQFVQSENTGNAISMVILGLLFTAFGFVFLCIVGYFSGYVGAQLLKKPNIARYLQHISGLVMIGLGLRLALLKNE